MANGSISNGQITASSQKIGKDKSFKAEYGRLNNKPSGAMGGAWCAQSSDKFQYLQIDLNKEMTLSGVATQGQIDAPNWVVKYSIQHSTDGTNWKDYKEFGHDRVSVERLEMVGSKFGWKGIWNLVDNDEEKLSLRCKAYEVIQFRFDDSTTYRMVHGYSC